MGGNFSCFRCSAYLTKNSKNAYSKPSVVDRQLSVTPSERTKPVKPASFRKRLSTSARHLTDNQKNLIRSTWHEATAVCKITPGVKIFQNIFRRHPELKKMFRLEHVENLDELSVEENFIRHARVFSNVIDLTVRNVDELDMQIAPALITFGRRHFYKHQIGFRPEYMTIFAMAVMDFLFEHLQDLATKETMDAWWFITVYLVTKLKQGYELESMHKGKQRLHLGAG